MGVQCETGAKQVKNAIVTFAKMRERRGNIGEPAFSTHSGYQNSKLIPKEDGGKNTKTLSHCRLKQFRDNGAKIHVINFMLSGF